MPNRRILSLWFPRLAAERWLRHMRGLPHGPFAIVGEEANSQMLVSLSEEAEAAGLVRGQPLRDARAMCPTLDTRLANPRLDAAFLTHLRRWAGKFSPWVSEEAPESLIIDLTGCAHLFGGEVPLMETVTDDCADLGLTVRGGIADTAGAAWALARYAGGQSDVMRTGDDISQEARATRSRAARRRHWERGGPSPGTSRIAITAGRISPPGQLRATLAPLPVAALRLSPDTVAMLTRLGIRQVGDLAGQPRAALARRFGRDLVRRLDQALGIEPEPVSPARPAANFAVRLSLPEPIGLAEDISAAIDRLLPPLGKKLREAGRGARRVRMECHRADHTMQWVEIGLARPSADPERIRPLLAMKIEEIEPGFGIDVVRIEASVTEPVHARQHAGHAEAMEQAEVRRTGGDAVEFEDLLGRIGARVGLDAITRFHPGDSHIPEKTFKMVGAVWSEPVEEWPEPPAPRPLEMWKPEIVMAEDTPELPVSFRWRGRTHEVRAATGPERIAPEWWLDEPEWRTGVRDYWRVTTRDGARYWLFYAHGGTMSGGWFCQGSFC